MRRYFLILSLLIVVPLVSAGENLNPRPFWGSFAGEAYFTPNPIICDDDGLLGVMTLSDSTGKMSHMGRSTFQTQHCPTADGKYALKGMASFTAANGDEVVMVYTATTTAPPPSIIQEADFIIVGGTGRFEGASGYLEGMVYVSAQDSFEVPWPIKFMLTGMIVY